MRGNRLVTLLWSVLALAAPVGAAVLLAYQLSLHDQQTRAAIMADFVLQRTTATTGQIEDAFTWMGVFSKSEACSPGAISLMRQIDVSSSLLQGVGFVDGTTLVCSSLGATSPAAVGAPDYRSSTDMLIRRQRELSIAPGFPMLLVTGPSGYTAFVHPGLIFSLTDTGKDLAAGVVSISTHEEIISSDGPRIDWKGIELPEGQTKGTLAIGDQLVAWQLSPLWDHFTYAAIPLAAVTLEFVAMSKPFALGGGLIGLGLLLLLHRLAAGRTSLHALLKAGLKRGEILTVYQPIADLRTGRWVGAEVLARWQRPNGEWISPELFVPLAEKHGLIGQLTQRVILQSMEELSAFIIARPGFFISLNVSSADLREPDFTQNLIAACASRNIPHCSVHLEITERAEVDPDTEAEAIRELRAQGFEIGIDDFGIGYSNLAYLDTLKLDYLKIDKAFVAGMPVHGIGTEIVDHIIELAEARGLTLIAEGVERDEQRTDLLSRGVRFGQGWLFARPMGRLDFVRAYAANLEASSNVETLPVSRVA